MNIPIKKHKIMALDLGDRWIGIALSDPLCMFARPYKTVEKKNLITVLKKELEKEEIKTIVVGYPKTMRDTESEQTKKTVSFTKELEKEFPHVIWILWDERLTSQQALTSFKKRQNKSLHKIKEERKQSHARAAAFILSSYLENLLYKGND